MKKVVVIGGGFAGNQIAKRLQNKFNVLLIDTKDYFEYTPGILRLAVNPDYKHKIRVKYSSFIKNLKIGKVTEINNNYILIGKEKISFDYLVITAGAKYGILPGIIAGNSEELIKSHEKLKKSKEAIIIGGGLVGVELAGEILENFPNKKITIIHSKDSLIERNHKKAIEFTKKFFEKKANLIYLEKAKIQGNQIALSNKKIKSELIYICTGISPNTDFMRKNFSTYLDKNQIKVNKNLQVTKNIFAAGDITNIQEEKTAQSAEKQGNIIAKNILNLEKNKPLLEYKPKKRAMVISLGKYNGIFEYKNFILTGKIPALLKWFIQLKTMIKYY